MMVLWDYVRICMMEVLIIGLAVRKRNLTKLKLMLNE